MASISKKTLIRVRGQLRNCLDLMHDEANASAKEEVIHAIAVLDNLIESDERQAQAELVIQLVGKIIEKLPWIVSVMSEID